MKLDVRLLIVVFCATSMTGCGGSSVRVLGHVTCQDKPVKGSILFSPVGEGKINSVRTVAVPLKDDGSFEVWLAQSGKYRAVVSPADIVYPAEPGKEYPCDLKAQEIEVKAGENVINIELPRPVE